MGLNARKPGGFANNTGAYQPAHALESIICKLVAGEISIFYLVSVGEETGLKLTLSVTPKTGFLATPPI